MAPDTVIRYRPNVVGIVTRLTGEILIGERSDYPGSWQFPQGGVKRGERRKDALVRELMEEIGLPAEKYEVGERRGPYRYRFSGRRLKENYGGQEQYYFRVLLSEPDFPFVLDHLGPKNAEFIAVRWIRPEDFRLGWLPEMKRPVYRDVLRDFFGVGAVG